MHKSTVLGLVGGAALTLLFGQWAFTTNPVESRASQRAAQAEPKEAEKKHETHDDEARDWSDQSRAEPPAESAAAIGPDVIMGGIHQTIRYGPIGGIYAYAFSSQTCSVGDEHLAWDNYGTPTFAMNAYRLHDGRLMQIGIGWVKHACCVANNNNPAICLGMTCQSGPGGVLRVGCLDVYSASWNGNQGYLGPRTGINPHTGELSSLPGGSGSAIERRIQIYQADMDATNFPDALYFIESVYVATDVAQAGNWYNNATYRRVTIDGSYAMTLQDDAQAMIPAIFAWADYGVGPGQPIDESVIIAPVDVPDEGRFYVGSKVIDNGDGTWRYEYAVYNLFSQRSAGSFAVPVGSDVVITDVGFHAPLYHSGEQQDNTPWAVSLSSDAIVWTTAESYLQNPNANAIRWGTLYNFWFTSDQPPVPADAELGLFIPGTPASVFVEVDAPTTVGIPGDLNNDGVVNVADLLILFDNWGPCENCDACPADLNGDCVVNVADMLILFGNWG
jgi:hypothetical protein